MTTITVNEGTIILVAKVLQVQLGLDHLPVDMASKAIMDAMLRLREENKDD